MLTCCVSCTETARRRSGAGRERQVRQLHRKPHAAPLCRSVVDFGKPYFRVARRQRNFPNSLSCRGSLRLRPPDSRPSPHGSGFRAPRMANFGKRSANLSGTAGRRGDGERQASRDPIPAAEPDTVERPVRGRAAAGSMQAKFSPPSAKRSTAGTSSDDVLTGAPMRPTFCSSATSARSAAAAAMRSYWSPTMRRLRSTPSSDPPSATRARA